MKIFFYTIFILILISSCKKEGLEKNFVECFGEAEILDEPSECNNTFNLVQQIVYCAPIEAGSYSLEDSSKLYLPHYCKNIGESIRYKNGNETIELEIDEKSYEIGTFTWITNIPCVEDGNNKRATVCIKTDVVNMMLSSDDFNLSFRMNAQHELNGLQTVGVADYLNIFRQDEDGWDKEASLIINQRTSSDNESRYQINRDRLNVGSGVFTDVITHSADNNLDDTFIYTINPYLGLLAFRDESNRLWTLIEE